VLAASFSSGQGSSTTSATRDYSNSNVIKQLFGKAWQSLQPDVTPKPAELQLVTRQ
jgi:hypothetical protein